MGWSRLVRADEDETLARLKALRLELIDPAITRHSGRIVKLMGDGLLAEFASVVDAVEAAITPRTKAIFLGFPNNPTGAVLDPDRIRAIAEVAERRDVDEVGVVGVHSDLADVATLFEPEVLPGDTGIG